jgi:hypothetical protein
MTTSIKVGDLVALSDEKLQWRVVYVDADHGFARLEYPGEAWVRSRVVELDDLRPVVSDTPPPVRTPREIVDEFAADPFRTS